MTGLITFLCVIVIVGVIAFMAFTPAGKQFAIKLKGRADVIAEKDASTVAGAQDYLAAALREKEDNHREAVQAYSEIAGELQIAERDLVMLKKELMKIDQSLHKAIDDGNDDDALHYASKRQNIEKQIEVLKNSVSEMRDMVDQQKEVMEHMENEVMKLREEKETTLLQMKSDERIAAMRNKLNAATSDSETDRMLEKVREGAKKARERAAGSKIVFDNSTQTKDRRIELKEQEDDARRLVEELKRQRGGVKW